MHPTTPSIFPEPAASSTRRTAAGVKADRRSPAGLGLDTGEDRRTLATAGTANTQVTFIPITCIMSMSGRPLIQVMRVILPIMNILSEEVSTQRGQGHDRSVCRGAVARCRTCPRAGTEAVASGGAAGARRSASGPEDVVARSAEDSDRASSTASDPGPRTDTCTDECTGSGRVL